MAAQTLFRRTLLVRAVVQRVSRARVVVGGQTVGSIGPGLCVLLGVATSDTAGEAERVAGKVARLRIFETRPASSIGASSMQAARHSSSASSR